MRFDWVGDFWSNIIGLRHAKRSLMSWVIVSGRAHPSFGMTPTFNIKKRNNKFKKKPEKSVSYQKKDGRGHARLRTLGKFSCDATHIYTSHWSVERPTHGAEWGCVGDTHHSSVQHQFHQVLDTHLPITLQGLVKYFSTAWCLLVRCLSLFDKWLPSICQESAKHKSSKYQSLDFVVYKFIPRENISLPNMNKE